MQLLSKVVPLFITAALPLGSALIANTVFTAQAFYDDSTYGNSSFPTAKLGGCSKELNPALNNFISKFKTIGEIPGYPNVVGTPEITEKTKDVCGSCFKLYNRATQTSIYVTAIDATTAGFVMPSITLKRLTGNNDGTADIIYRPVGLDNCKIPIKVPKDDEICFPTGQPLPPPPPTVDPVEDKTDDELSHEEEEDENEDEDEDDDDDEGDDDEEDDDEDEEYSKGDKGKNPVDDLKDYISSTNHKDTDQNPDGKYPKTQPFPNHQSGTY